MKKVSECVIGLSLTCFGEMAFDGIPTAELRAAVDSKKSMVCSCLSIDRSKLNDVGTRCALSVIRQPDKQAITGNITVKDYDFCRDEMILAEKQRY